MLRVITIFLRHGTTRYPGAEEHMDELCVRQMPDMERHKVVVDTMLPLSHVDDANPARVVLGGDNSFSEWSAADGAIRFLGERIWNYDLVHFATAAFHTLYVRYLDRFDMRMLHAIHGKPVCVGHIDCYNNPVALLSYQSQRWLRTSFLFLPPAELKSLRTLAPFRSPERVFSGDPEAPFRHDAPLCARYQTYILNWLTGADIGQGTSWHSGFGLNHENLPAFERKTLAILNEHLFSIRLRENGCALLDTTWLATWLARHASSGHPIPCHTNWREQLATRDTDPLVLPA